MIDVSSSLIIQTGSLGVLAVYLGFEARRNRANDKARTGADARREELAAKREVRLMEIVAEASRHMGEQNEVLRGLSSSVSDQSEIVAACVINHNQRVRSGNGETLVEKLKGGGKD
jgi:hypothetical protein